MNYKIDFSESSAKVLRKWKKSNPIAFSDTVVVIIVEVEGHYQDK